MIQADSIIAAVSVAFNADANMVALCPGGFWHRRAPTGTERPYAIGKVVPQDDKEFISDKSCIQTFLLGITIYGDQTTDNTGMIASYLSAWDFDANIFVTLPARTLGVYPAGEDLDLAPEEKSGEDVVLASVAWRIKLHFPTQTIPK